MKKSPPPPGVLFLLDWRPVFWSTREEYFRQLAAEFSARGITPVLVPSELTDQEVLRRFKAAGARVEPLSYLSGVFAYWRRIRELRREFSFQFAHVRFFDYFSLVPWLCFLAGIPTIFFTESNGGEWQATPARQALIRLRTRLMCWPLTGVIAISRFIQDRLEQVGIPRAKISVIYNGVDLAAYKPDPEARKQLRAQTGASQNTIVLISAGALISLKRPEIFLRIGAELARRGLDVQIWMTGTGPLLESLQSEARQLGLEHRVHWLGHQKELQRWMAAADLFLHAAIGEAFGNVLVEAMACGLPIIATRSGAAAEIVEEGQSGLLIPRGPEEIRELARAIADIMSRPDRYAAWSAHAQKTALLFNTGTCVQKTMDFYHAFGMRRS